MKPFSHQCLTTLALSLAICLGSSALGLAVNAIRSRGLHLVAAFPYENECPDQIKTSSSMISAFHALRIGQSRSVLFLDARPKEDFDKDHIPKARSMPYSFVTPVSAAEIEELKKYLFLIAYCDSPENRLASLLANQIRERGIKGVRVLEGGLEAYRNAKKISEKAPLKP